MVSDLNGILRGKRLPASMLPKLREEGFKMPRSVLGTDIWGDDVEDNGLVFETGDSDGICKPVYETPKGSLWHSADLLHILCTMFNPDGSPFMADPRQILADVVARYAAKGITPVVATELEFYLYDALTQDSKRPVQSKNIHTVKGIHRPNVYSMSELDRFGPMLADIRAACTAQGIPVDSVTSEFGPGQFELNILHENDPLLAADHAILFKRAVKGVASKHHHYASFMAKPNGNTSGNGLHVHFSLLDESGHNIFNSGTPEGTDTLRHAMAGLIKALPVCMLIFAPHLNSYRRFVRGSHAPVIANWGYENRTVALRVPESPNAARRIEHRVSGADANPYLVIAAVLAAALYGIEHKLTPPKPTEGDSYAEAEDSDHLPTQWWQAVELFETSDLVTELLGAEFQRVYAAIKNQEIDKFSRRITDVEFDSYMGVL
jgi:glutamine synthetase